MLVHELRKFIALADPMGRVLISSDEDPPVEAVSVDVNGGRGDVRVSSPGPRLAPGERVIGLLPAEWEAVRRALAFAGDSIEERGAPPDMEDDQGALAAVLERMGGRPL